VAWYSHQVLWKSINVNVENVNLRGYKWNETVSNRIRYASNRICNVSNEMCIICATSYVTADNSRPMAYLVLKGICKWKNKDWYIQKWSLFYSQITVQCLNNYPKHEIIFLILQTFNRLPWRNRKRWIRTYCEWHTLKNASFSKMQSVLVHRLQFTSYDHLFLSNTANSIPLFSRWRNIIGNQLTDVTTN
jgi:hypothetical protein